MRIDRLLANSGYGSRTAVKEMIRKGQVFVDGLIVTNGRLIIEDPSTVSVSIAGEPAGIRRILHYMMNKPAGCITALKDKRHPTIADFIPSNLLLAGLFPVGRLDLDTTGLLLLTSDGVLAHRLTSPKWHVEKEYYFELEGKYLDETDRKQLAEGLILGDGTQLKSAALQVLTSSSGILTIREGKYHQVKRMMKALGGTVIVLQRIRMGPVVLDNTLKPGEIRELTESEIKSLYESAQYPMEMGSV